MLSRREVITAGFAGSLNAAPSAAEAASAQLSSSDRDVLLQIAKSVDAVNGSLTRSLLSNNLAHGHVIKLRASMEQFLRGAAKFPDFIDVGFNVFMDVYDWHVKNQQQLVVTKGADGRYWMQFMFSTLLLRHEQDSNYIGLPYDKP